ncbi:MAG: diacylglycerol O-acyltransferase / wax synthase [Solirubrobacteraceae bacterium]|nr:diacylglycerol O-acyltransferase / wax synthase [Solirubrobacteraceae bacterium]
MWRTEVSPLLRSTGVVMEVLDSAPDRERVIAAHEWGSRLLAPLRHRVVEDPLGLASARWVVDQDFDMGYHLRFGRLPEPGTLHQALEAAQALAMTPFDRARPLWEAVLLDGLDGGRAVYLLKLHHSIADGQGTVQMFDILHGESPEPGRARELPVPAPEHVSGTSIALDTLLSAPGRLLRESIGVGARIASGALQARPHDVLEAIRYAESLGRMLGPPPAQGSILLAQRSLNRRYGVLDVALNELRTAGKACGGTVNDVFVSALVGGMRRYHEHHGIELGALTLALPISLRKDEDPPGSNRFAGARILAPLAELDPRTRMRIIGERTAAARSEPALGFMDALSPAMSRLPAALVATMTERVTRSIDLQASNVRGLDRTAYLAGAGVERMYAFGAAPGPAVMVTLMSYNGTCHVAVNVNAAAIPDHELFVGCLQAGLDEMVGPGRPKRRRTPARGTIHAA